MPIRSISKYWLNDVLPRAWDDTCKATNFKPFASLLGIVYIVIAYFIYRYIFLNPADKSYDKIIWFVLAILPSVLIAAVLFLVAFLFLTPSKLYGEALDDHERLKKKIEDLESELISAMTVAVKDKKRFDASLEQANRKDHKRNYARSRFETLITKFEKLVIRCEREEKQAIEDFYSLDAEAVRVVSNEFGDTSELTKKHPHRNTHVTKIKYDQDDFTQSITVCRDRIKCLNTMLGYFD